MTLVIALVIAAGLGLIPASIAKRKGYSFGLWWFYGWMLFIVAIIHVALIEDKNKKPVAYVPVGGAYANVQNGAAVKSESCARLFTLPERLYQIGAPVCIVEGALLKNEQNGCVLSQLKLQSITDKTIRAVKASVSLMDAFGKPMNVSVEHQYLDLCVKRGHTFGEETTVILPDAHARAFRAAVTAVMFDDGTLWEASDAAWEPLPAPVMLDEVYPDAELRKQFKLEFGEQNQYAYAEFADLCRCLCGALNRPEEAKCHSCGCDLTALRALDSAELRKRRDACLERERLAEEERQARKKKEAAEAAERAKKAKKIALIAAPIVCVVIAFLIVLNSVIIPNSKYNDAVALMEAGQYEEAIEAFEAMDGYKDSADNIESCEAAILDDVYDTAVALMEAGDNVEATEILRSLGDYKDAREVCCSLWDRVTGRKQTLAADYHTVALKSDGTVAAVGNNNDGQCDVSDWTDIVAIETGYHYTVGLKSNGTVVAVGYNTFGQCDVADWTDIVSIAAGSNHTVGLKSDGTVVAAGYNRYDRCEVSGWTNVVAIAAGNEHTVGLRADGTMVAVGNSTDNWREISDWRNIVAVAAGDHTVGLKSDGTVAAVGYDDNGQYAVSDWTDVVMVAAGGHHTVGLKSDGTVVAVGDNDDGKCDVSGWTDIVAIAAGYGYTVGLKTDGTVVAVGNNGYGKCDVSDWTDIVAIAAGSDHTIGLRTDGTVVAVGDNGYGQCDVSG